MSSRSFRLAIILIVLAAGLGWLGWTLSASSRRVGECVKLRQEFGYSDGKATCKSLENMGMLKR